MKKKIIIFMIIILLVLGCVLVGSYFILGKNEKANVSTQLGEAINKEVIKFDNQSSMSGYAFEDGTFYYVERKDITDERGEYYLNTYSVKTGEKNNKKIFDNQNAFCYLNDGFVRCSDDEKEYVFDLSLNKLREEKYNENNYYEAFIEYKGDYYEYFVGELKKDKDKIKIPGYDDDTFTYYDNIVFDDNTYLLFMSSNEYYIYNIKDNSLTNTHEERYFKYNDGYVFYSTMHYHIYDLKDNKEMNYDFYGLVSPKTEYYGIFKDNKLYQISNETNQLEIYNAKKNKMTSFDISEFLDYAIREIRYFDNKICIIATNDLDLELITINIDNIRTKFVDIYEYLINQNKEIEDKIEEIKENYNINIKIKDEGEREFPDFTSQTVYNNAVISHTIKRVESILSKFPKHFFENFTHDDYKGLNIYLASKLNPSDPSTQASNPVAYTLTMDNTYTIVLDSFYSEFENTVCHELMHAMENNLNNKNKNIFTRWNSLNPSGFSYYDAYNGFREYEYTPFMTSDKNVYFVSNYSYTFENEDRAEIFGKMCSEETNEDLKKYPNLYKKAQAIKDELIANYPELKDSVVLKNY